MSFIDWLIFGIPWWVQTGIALILVTALLAFASGIIGVENVKKIAVPLLGIVAALSLGSRAQQRGYRERVRMEEEARKRAEKIADEKQDQVKDLPDDKLDDEVDRWSRP